MEKLRLRLSGFLNITHVSKQNGISMKNSLLWVMGESVSFVFWISVPIVKSVFTPELNTTLSCSTDFDGSCCFWADFDHFLFLYLKFWERGCLIQFPSFLFEESLSLYIQYNFCYFRIHPILLNYRLTHSTCKWHLYINVYQSTREDIYCFCFYFLTLSTLALSERIHLIFLLLLIAFIVIILFSCWVMCDFFATLWTIAHQVPLSMGFSRQECWNGLSFPTPGHLPDPRIKPSSPALPGSFFTTEPHGKPIIALNMIVIFKFPFLQK